MRELLTGYERAERLGGVYSLRSDARWRAAKGRELLFTRVGDELRARGAWFAEPERAGRVVERARRRARRSSRSSRATACACTSRTRERPRRAA